MITISVSTADYGNRRIKLGKQGEHEVRQIAFDLTFMIERYGDGLATLVFQRNGDPAPYTITATRSENLLTWTVNETDTAVAGPGKAEIRWYVSGALAKTVIFTTETIESMVSETEVPDRLQTWYDQLIDYVDAQPQLIIDDVQGLIDGKADATTVANTYAKKTDVPTKTSQLTNNSGFLTELPSGYVTEQDLASKGYLTEDDISGKADQEDLDVLSSRFDNAVSAVSTDTELTDIRVTVDGTTETTAGTAVRKQVQDLKDDISSLNEDITNMSTATSSDVGKALKAKTVTNGKVTEWEFGAAGGADPADIEQAVEDYLDEHPVVASAAGVVSVADYGAVGDGVTDDTAAIQRAVNDNYDVYFESDKTYYLASTVTINHDIKLHGGKNTVIKTLTANNALPNVFVVEGTLKKTTTLTTDYTSDGTTANSGNQFTLANMTDVNIGDMMIVKATDQYYSYARQYYYLGATLLIGDIYNGHIYTTNSMPWDIALTSNVSVEIYDAPSVIIEGLKFIGELQTRGGYHYMILLDHCKNSVIRHCEMSNIDNGIMLDMCANTLVEDVSMSKSKETNDRPADGYGIYIGSSSDTIIERMQAICAQSCVCLSGTIPNINTYVRNCDLGCECRRNAIGSHENAYNTIIEDCTLAGLNVLGTIVVNRCRFIRNNRIDSNNGLSFTGSHNPKYASLRVYNCIFEDSSQIYLTAPSAQTPIQSCDNIIGLVEFSNCENGRIVYEGKTDAYNLSNVIKKMRLINWTNLFEIYHSRDDDIIENIEVNNCTFVHPYWINKHNDALGLALTNVYNCDFRSSLPMMHKIAVNKPTMGEKYTLPGDTPIYLSSDNASAKFLVCGRNLASNDPTDYVVGSVSKTSNDDLNRTAATGDKVPTVSVNDNGDIVYTQKNNVSSYFIYTTGLVCVKERGTAKISLKLKNTGETEGAQFRPYITQIDAATGKVLYIDTSAEVQATAEGASIEYVRDITRGGILIMCYLRCTTAVANAETTFEDMKISFENTFAPSPLTDQDTYEARRLTGDGTVLSLPGVNHIMSSELNFHVALQADYINNPILPSTAQGVMF